MNIQTLRIAVSQLLALPRWLPKARRSRTAKARRVVLTFVLLTLAANVVLSIGMDTFWASLRDAEYGARRVKLQARVAANPERPLAVVLGSSRTDFGIRPLAAECGPLVCNVSEAGSGPLLQLLTLRRLLHDGAKPKELIVEYWPPFLAAKPGYNEECRLDPHRYLASDEAFIREYLSDPDETLRLMREVRRTPFWNHRLRLLSRVLPSWLKYDQRMDGNTRVDAAGWLPGPVMPADRARSVQLASNYYIPGLRDYAIDPKAERALRELIATAQEMGARVTLVWMPESSEFRSWYPAETEAEAWRFLHSIEQETGVRVIIARDWLPDTVFPDSFHMTPDASIGFTQRLFSYFP